MTSIEKKVFIKKILRVILILLVVSIILVTVTLNFSKRYDLLGWSNALFFSGFLFFAFSWMMIISNANLFIVPLYGIRQFLAGLLGRKPKKDIIEYRDSRRQVPRYIIVTTLCYGIIIMLISLGIYYIF